MPRTFISTPELHQIPLYSHVIRAGDTIHVSGQVAWNSCGDVIGVDDPEAQIAQFFINLDNALRSADIGVDDVVDITIFYTDDRIVDPVMTEFSARFESPGPCLTGIKVAALAGPDLLIEIKMTAHAPNANQKTTE